MAYGNTKQVRRKADFMILDSVTTSHLTPCADLVQATTSSDLSFTLSDNTQMRATPGGPQWFA